MKMSKISTVVASAVLALTVSGNVLAAENAEGVKEHFGLFVQKTKEAYAQAMGQDKDECVRLIKAAKQHYKEVTGDAAGKPLQDAIKDIKVAQDQCSEGKFTEATATLASVVAQVEAIQKAIK